MISSTIIKFPSATKEQVLGMSFSSHPDPDLIHHITLHLGFSTSWLTFMSCLDHLEVIIQPFCCVYRQNHVILAMSWKIIVEIMTSFSGVYMYVLGMSVWPHYFVSQDDMPYLYT